MTVFASIELALIASSLTNPRKTFDPVKLAELANSIRASGVHQPVLVRPLPAARLADTFLNRGDGQPLPTHELVAGERRWRASTMAGVTTIPAMVREMTDAQVLECQLVENLQRDDLTELEEAEGYEALIAHSGISADALGDKIGKSRSHVYARLKLLDLGTDGRTALRDGKLDASRALLIARIPDSKLQAKAVKEITIGDYHSGGDPMSHRKAAEWVQKNYMLKLSAATFNISDACLVPSAGACMVCPKRTGHDPDLFSDVKGADVCTDPTCFHQKEEAHAAILIQQAKDKGQTVIAGKEALELMTSNYNPKFKGYRRLDVVKDSPTNQPLRKIIGKQMQTEGITAVMIEHPQKKGELVAALANEVVLRLLKTVDGQAQAAKTVTKEVREFADDKKAKAERKAMEQFEQDWRNQIVARTWHELHHAPDKQAFTIDVHRYLALQAARNLSTDDSSALCQLLDLGKVATSSALVDFVKTTPRPDLAQLLMVMQRDSSAHDYGRIANEGMLLVAGIVFGDELKKVLIDVKTVSKERFFQAPPDTTPGPQRKPKLSAQAAMAGISAAIQGEENILPPGDIYAVDQRVRVVTDDDKLGIIARKWAGKEGTITRREDGGGYWDVTFRGRNGGIAMFADDQLEAA